MTRLLVICAIVLTGLSGACGHQLSHVATTVRTIEISDAVSPHTLYTKAGEEIRWQNLRSNTVRVGFLSKRLLGELGCRKGVPAFLGEVEDLVTIGPGESVGLCPLRTGVLQYNVWFDPDNPKGAISRTGTVHVERGG